MVDTNKQSILTMVELDKEKTVLETTKGTNEEEEDYFAVFVGLNGLNRKRLHLHDIPHFQVDPKQLSHCDN